MVQSPYAIYGFISGAGAGITVTALNNTSAETTTATTSVDNSFLIDCANFASGYTNGDTVTLSCTGYPNKTVTIDTTNYPYGFAVLIMKANTAASYDPFAVFDWKYTITKVVVIPGYHSQTTGIWVPEVTSEVTISGNVSNITIKELSYLDPNLFNMGDRKISLMTDYGLVVGDRIKIYEDQAGDDITEWNVMGKKGFSNLLNVKMGVTRDTFYLKRLLDT